LLAVTLASSTQKRGEDNVLAGAPLFFANAR